MELSKELNRDSTIDIALCNYTSKNALSDEQKKLRFKLFKWLKKHDLNSEQALALLWITFEEIVVARSELTHKMPL